MHIAYQVVGTGADDLVVSMNLHPVDTVWEDPQLSDLVERLAETSRVIMFDRRGAGASDPVPGSGIPTLEDLMADLLAVLEAASSPRCALLKTDHAGVGLLAAATYPERIVRVIFVNAYARLAWAPDYRFGIPAKRRAALFRDIDTWSPDLGINDVGLPRAQDRVFREWFARGLRATGGPARSAAIYRQEMETDARHLLPVVNAPALVLHSSDNPYLSMAHGRYIAEHLPTARFVELAGSGHSLATVDVEAVVEEVTEFVTGERPRPRSGRVFATVVFTDIAESTPFAVRLGDTKWRALLDRHDETIQRQLDRFGGRLVNTTGDGVVAAFDGPARAIDFAVAARDALDRLGLRVRIGIHAGEVEQRGDDMTGIAVHVAARVQSHAKPGEIAVSRTVVDLVAGSGILFDDRGNYELKGVPGHWQLFAVAAR